MGAGYASLQSLAAIEPDFLKFDVSLVRDIDRSSIKRSLLESLRQLAEKISARVIAEGVERAGGAARRCWSWASSWARGSSSTGRRGRASDA